MCAGCGFCSAGKKTEKSLNTSILLQSIPVEHDTENRWKWMFFSYWVQMEEEERAALFVSCS